MPFRSFCVWGAAAVALVLPASAAAATIVVDPSAPTGCANNVCKTIKDAVGAVQESDVIDVRPGNYVEPPLDVLVKNVTIQAAPGTVAITSGSIEPGADIFTLSADGIVLRNLIVGMQENGGQAVQVKAKATTLEGMVLVHAAKSNLDEPLYLVDDAVERGANTIRTSFVIHTPDRPAPGSAPAVQGNGTSSLALVDSLILSGAESGNGVVLPGNDTVGTDPTRAVPNQILRSAITALKPDADAVSLSSASDSPRKKQLVVDSAVLSGGQNGAGLRAKSEPDNSGLTSSSDAGDIDIDLIHATVAGAQRAMVLHADANGPGFLTTPESRGSIDASVDRSIFHGGVLITNYDGDLARTANTARLNVGRSNVSPDLKPSNESGSEVIVSQTSTHPAAALFVDQASRNYALRADAPVIDVAGPVLAGESDRDVNGEPRLVGNGTDLGADEFLNRPPLAKIKTGAAEGRQNAVLGFDASESVDPEGAHGGGIAEYRWDFGDGATAVTTTPVAEHAYANIAGYDVRVTVVDNFGVISAPSDPLRVNVIDGFGPRISIAQPRAGIRLNRYRTTKQRRRVKGKVKVFKRRKPILRKFTGTATDESGVKFVEVSMKLVTQASSRARKSQSPTCRYLHPKRHTIVGQPCSKPLFFPVRFREGIWAYSTKRATRLRPGLYELSVRATDGAGAQSTTTVNFTFR